MLRYSTTASSEGVPACISSHSAWCLFLDVACASVGTEIWAKASAPSGGSGTRRTSLALRQGLAERFLVSSFIHDAPAAPMSHAPCSLSRWDSVNIMFGFYVAVTTQAQFIVWMALFQAQWCLSIRRATAAHRRMCQMSSLRHSNFEGRCSPQSFSACRLIPTRDVVRRALLSISLGAEDRPCSIISWQRL